MSVALAAVYTRPWTVELILDLAGYKADTDLVDKIAVEPSAGDGAFLLPMIERLVDSCRRQKRSITDCASSLIAYELDAASVHIAQRAVITKLIALGVSESVAHKLVWGWIKQGDYLLERGREEESGLFSTEDRPNNCAVDFVIGNPPYIRLEDIPADKNREYRRIYQTMQGRADIYVAFFEAALRQIRLGGVCAFICADRWMLNQYGGELRKFITSYYSVEAVIEVHKATVFETDVSAYPAITIIRREIQGPAVVASANGETNATAATEAAGLLQSLRLGGDGSKLPRGVRACRTETWFNGSEPWPCTSPERLALLKDLERRFQPLESKATGTKVGIGVATGLDKVYLTNDPQLVEPDRLLPLARPSDITTGTLKWSGHYLINPWSKEGLVSLDDFPRLKSYYENHRARLEMRNVAKRDARNWYRTIDRVNIALVKQSKLYIPDIKNTIHPVLDVGLSYPHHNLYVITSSGWDLRVLGALLMSDVGRFFVECYGVRMRGGYLRMQAQYLRRIRVPKPESISLDTARILIEAFNNRDHELATRIALELYDIDHVPSEE
jgi:adenine-specific DNA-methyltransferase